MNTTVKHNCGLTFNVHTAGLSEDFLEVGRLRGKEHAFGPKAGEKFIPALHVYSLKTWLHIHVHGKHTVESVKHTHNKAVQREINE